MKGAVIFHLKDMKTKKEGREREEEVESLPSFEFIQLSDVKYCLIFIFIYLYYLCTRAVGKVIFFKNNIIKTELTVAQAFLKE